MRLKTFLLLTFYFLLLTFSPGCSEHIKEPSVAGVFYPSDGNDLRQMVDSFLAGAQKQQVEGKLIALISPHAGYRFSGHVAAYSYSHLKDRDIRTVILIGPSHHIALSGASVYVKGSMKTPLGNIKINGKTAKSLINEKADVNFYPDAFDKEHSLEVQLPFLQQTLKDFKIVPILIGSPTKASFEHLTEKLAELLNKNEKTIIIASTDLSHYHDYETAVKMDHKIIDAIERMSIKEVERYLISGECEMCGMYPVILTMNVARKTGATNGLLFKYANSGDVTNDRRRVVGYSAIGLYKSTLTKREKEELLSLAKNTIVNYVMHSSISTLDINDKRLKANAATFVTINKNGRLRGCIGNIHPFMPLYKSVIRNAVSACSGDPRFPPMNKEELKNMDVEISILSPLEPFSNIQDIVIGKHGLYLIKGHNSGLLLPQVAEEYNWDTITFLEQLSIKAGLPRDAWKSAKLYRFTAEIIR